MTYVLPGVSVLVAMLPDGKILLQIAERDTGKALAHAELEPADAEKVGKGLVDLASVGLSVMVKK